MGCLAKDVAGHGQASAAGLAEVAGRPSICEVDLLTPAPHHSLKRGAETQEELSLRHYDMKLLNFFLARAPETDGARSLVLRYGLHGAIYDLALEPGSPSLCMLADFGTAEINAGRLRRLVVVVASYGESAHLPFF
eukprot:860100-Pleurochrysis_carterae.AAC.2